MNVGWSESFYDNASSLSVATSDFTTLMTNRTGIMLATTVSDGYRISNVDHPRDGVVSGPPAGTTPGLLTGPGFTPAGVWDCLLVRLDVAGLTAFNKRFLHMMPAQVFLGRTYLGAAAPAPWPANMALWLNLLAAGTIWQVRKVVAGSPVYTPITQAVPQRRTERRLGRPFDTLRGRRAIA